MAHPQVQVELGLRARQQDCLVPYDSVSGSGIPYAAVLGHWDRERLRRKGDGAQPQRGHCSPKACMVGRAIVSYKYN